MSSLDKPLLGGNFMRGQFHGENFVFQFGANTCPTKKFCPKLGSFFPFVNCPFE